ncbi:hypothetical protein [Haladaptatus sp. CMAA 1911]|uniref:hypothetical protein n=1 Tax=unclassified Haladaptatus TaxID=2622732 RepID=UPI003754D517
MCATLLTVSFAGTGAAQIDAGVNASVGNATGEVQRAVTRRAAMPRAVTPTAAASVST